MSLQITMIKAPGNVPVSKESQMFDLQGGTIGRGDNNALVLADPDRFLSSQHCQIHCEAGRYYLIDLSTNGTFVNGSPEPLGKGGKVALANDDMFEVGDYQFKVMLAPESSLDVFSGAVSPFDDLPTSADPLFGMGSEPSDNSFAGDPFGATDNFIGELSLSPDPELTDPLAALDQALGPQGQPVFDSAVSFGVEDRLGSASATFGGATYSDQADALNQSVAWPESSRQNLIPEEWEDELGVSSLSSPPSPSSATSSAASAIPAHFQESSSALQPNASRANIDGDLSDLFDTPLGPPSAEPFAEQAFTLPVNASASPVEAASVPSSPSVTAAPPTPAPAAPSAAPVAPAEPAGQRRASTPTAEPGSTAVGGDRRLVEGMGLNVTNLSDEQIAEISSEVGLLMREVVGGMMQVLRSRSSIKNEFRMNVTTIQPVENNPLKFSADVDEAIDNMFVRRSGAYKKPLDAMREGFQEIGEHQVAMIAGIRHGFEQMMSRFDPELLEKHFDKQSKGSMLPAVKKARYWSNYSAHYKGFVDNMENSFQHMFGGDFVQAYEDQLRKMSSARKKNNG